MFSAILAGCGGPYTKHDFVASANAICAAAVRDSRQLVPPTSGQLSALAPYLAKVVPIVQSEDRQMRALQHPTGSRSDSATLAKYLAALKQSVADFQALEAAAKAGNRSGVASAEAALRVTPVTSLAASYGLRSCAAAGATVA
ncbi:MAG: hypothetical protein M3071_21540 [Actinomycetota bacterium]|nr:hypothetical protein [Actinomycetota bacterium]